MTFAEALAVLEKLLGKEDLIRLVVAEREGKRIWIEAPNRRSVRPYIGLVSTVFNGDAVYRSGDEGMRGWSTDSWIRITPDGRRLYECRPDIDTDGVWRCDLHLTVPAAQLPEGDPTA